MMGKISVLDGIELTNLVKVSENYIVNGGDFSVFEQDLQDAGNEILCNICSNVLTILNQQIKESQARKHKWEVTREDSKKILMLFGWCNYSRTLFKKKNENEYSYLLDKLLDFENHSAASDNVKAVTLKEASETSYQKAGSLISKKDPLTKATIKNYLHKLDFPEPKYEEIQNKRTVETLYIEADEDHAHLQFIEKKGDIEKSKSGRKRNGIITKMIYVHEGARPVGNQKKRNKLINIKYFTSVANSEDNYDFWKRVSNYIAATYNVDVIKQVIIQGDGGSWIQAGLDQIPKSKFILDEFHLKQSLKKISRCAYDSSNEVYKCLLNAIKTNNAEDFIFTIKDVAEAQDKESKLKSIKRETEVLINHWNAAHERLNSNDDICGCSAEGHISHGLSKRMSRDPLGWSLKGATNIARLIEAKLNGDNFVEIVKYQKVKQNMAEDSDIRSFMKEFEQSLKPAKICDTKEMYAKYYDSVQRISSPARTIGNWLEKELLAS